MAECIESKLNSCIDEIVKKLSRKSTSEVEAQTNFKFGLESLQPGGFRQWQELLRLCRACDGNLFSFGKYFPDKFSLHWWEENFA